MGCTKANGRLDLAHRLEFAKSSLYHCLPLILSDFNFSQSYGYKVMFHLVLICITVLTNEDEHPFIGLLTCHVFFL